MCIGVAVVVIEVGGERQETADEACERLSDGSIHPYSPNCDDQSSDWTIPCVLDVIKSLLRLTHLRGLRLIRSRGRVNYAA